MDEMCAACEVLDESDDCPCLCHIPDRMNDTCEATKPAKYGLPPWRCELEKGHDGQHAEGLPSPIAGQLGFVYRWDRP